MIKLSGPMLAPTNGEAPDSAVVLLHGYGSDGNDLIGLAPHWQDVLPGAIFVSPHAPEPAGMNGAGFQWFAIDFGGDRLASRQTGVLKARPVLEEFLNDLWTQTGIKPERTVLVGFSQGAMMALHVGMALPQRLMGVVGFSGAFLAPEGFSPGATNGTPVCLVHGDMDDVVEPARSAEAAAELKAAGVDVAYHVSRGVGHGIAPDGLGFATQFLADQAAK